MIYWTICFNVKSIIWLRKIDFLENISFLRYITKIIIISLFTKNERWILRILVYVPCHTDTNNIKTVIVIVQSDKIWESRSLIKQPSLLNQISEFCSSNLRLDFLQFKFFPYLVSNILKILKDAFLLDLKFTLCLRKNIHQILARAAKFLSAISICSEKDKKSK